MAAKQPDKNKDYITNKVLIVFSVCMLGVLGLMYLNNILSNTTHVMAGLQALNIGKYVGLLLAVLGGVQMYRERQKKEDLSYKLVRGSTLILFGAVVFVMFFLLYRYPSAAFKAFYILLPAFAFYYLIYYSYQREFFVVALDCGIGAALAYAANSVVLGNLAMVFLAIGIVLAVAQILLVARMKKEQGKLTLFGKELTGSFSEHAYLMMQLGAVVLAAAALLGVLLHSVLLAGLLAAVVFIVSGVYYTVKLV